jgi:IS30 family transposase
MMAKTNGKDTETVIDALIKHAHKLPTELYKSLTWDRGKEVADHERFTLATDIKVTFCDPQSPWQRGSNENTNGLRRPVESTRRMRVFRDLLQTQGLSRRLRGRPGWLLTTQSSPEVISKI